jgi:hypothetical protein
MLPAPSHVNVYFHMDRCYIGRLVGVRWCSLVDTVLYDLQEMSQPAHQILISATVSQCMGDKLEHIL